MNGATVAVHGVCAPEFGEVAKAFARNFSDHGEVGAAVSICVDGKPVVDLWGGTADRYSGRPWAEDTMAVVFSATKGMAATCMHMLAERGLLNFDVPVASYWPEFAAN